MATFNYTYLSNANVSTGDGNDTLTVNNPSGDGLSSSTLNTGNGNDSVVINSSYNSSGANAIYNSNVFLGDGNDTLNAQAIYGNYDYNSSSVDAGSGDDTVYAYTPSYSTFIGGTGKDTIVFSGNRSSWDLEFTYTTAGSLDYISISNSNKLYNFEVFIFDDVSLDLTTAPLDANGLSRLDGTAPTLNSKVTSDLWDGLGFNRLTLTSLSNADVSTGDGNDSVTVNNPSGDGLSSSTLNTGNGNDSVVINSSYNSSGANAIYNSNVFLGDGNDTLNAQAIYGNYDYNSSSVDAGSGDDTVYTPSYSTFIGGTGKDTIIFSGLFNNWSINTKAKDQFGKAYIAVGSNRVYGFEAIQFQQPDPSGLLTQTLKGGVDGIDPLAAWNGKPLKQGSRINEAPLTLSADVSGNQLLGSSFADELTGSAMNDVITGGRGSDRMSGLGGSDLFVLDRSDWYENDRITDFQPKIDKLLVTGLSTSSVEYLALRSAKKKTVQSAVATAKDDNAALISKATLVYSKVTGNLYYNPNQQALGLGSEGGIIAILPPGLTISGTDVLASATLPF